MGRKLTAASASTLALGMALALLAVVWSALRAGSNTALFRLGLDDADAAAGAAQPLVDDEEGRAFVQARALLSGAGTWHAAALKQPHAHDMEGCVVLQRQPFGHSLLAWRLAHVRQVAMHFARSVDGR